MGSVVSNIKSRIASSSLIRSFFVTVFGSGMSKFILVAATFYCTNVLTKTEFGEFSFIRNTLVMILTICANNFSSLCTKFATEAKTSIESIQRLFLLFLFSFGLCVAAGAILEFLPEKVISSLIGDSVSVDYFRVAGLLLPVFMLQPLVEGVLRGMMKFKLIGYIQIMTSVLYVVTIVVGIELGRARGAIIGLYIYYVLYSLIVLFYLLKNLPVNKVLKKINGFTSQNSTLYKMILPVFVLSFVEAPIFWYLQVLLTKHATVEAVASMTVMKQVRNFAVLIPTYFFNTFLAYAGKMNAEGKYVEYFDKFDRFLRLFGFIGLGIAVVLSIFSRTLLGLYSPEYEGDWLCLCVSNLCIPLAMLMTLLKTELLLQEHQRYLMTISIFWNILWIGLYCLMVWIGFDALVSFFVSESIGLLVNFFLSMSLYRKDKKVLLN